MTDWLSAALPVLAAAAILIVPGYATVRVLGFRGLEAWALAGPVSVPIIAAASILSPLVGIPWSVLGPLAVTGIVCAVIVVLRLTMRKTFAVAPERVRVDPIVPVALAIGGLLIAMQFILIAGDPENISQTFDNIFHLNAAQYIVDTQNASPLSVSQLTRRGAEGITFYPAVWHGVVALVAQSTGVSLAAASNALMIAAGALLWPASVLLLGTKVFGRSRPYMIAVGVLAAAAPAFPILMIDFGVLYPYFLALCVLPAVVATTLALFGIVDRTPARTTAPWLLAAFAGATGLLFVHPSAFVAWMLLAGITAIAAWGRYVGRGPARSRVWIATAALLLAGVVAFVLWRALRPAIELYLWPPWQTPGQAIGEVLTMSMERGQIPVVLALAVLAGIVIAWRRKTTASRITLIFLLALGLLFIVTSSMQWLWLRRAIGAAWYNNSPRLAALIPMIAIPVAAVAVAVLWTWIVRRASGRLPAAGTPVFAALATIATVLLVVVSQAVAVPQAVAKAHAVYVPTADSPLLTPDELTLIERLPDLVPEDAVIAGVPGTGAAMAYALAGREVLHPGVLIEMTDDIALIDEEANEAEPGSPVCDALERERVRFILDFGDRQINNEAYVYPGFEDLEQSEAVTLVDEVGEARLYEIVACDRG